MNKKITMKDWRKRIKKAKKEGSFSKKDLETIRLDPCGCIRGELGKRLGIKHRPYTTVITIYPEMNELESEMMLAVEHNNITRAEEIIEEVESLTET